MKTQPTMNKFHVFTVRKNTRNRQLTYLYLSPCFYTVRAFLARVLAVFVLGRSRLFPFLQNTKYCSAKSKFKYLLSESKVSVEFVINQTTINFKCGQS